MTRLSDPESRGPFLSKIAGLSAYTRPAAFAIVGISFVAILFEVIIPSMVEVLTRTLSAAIGSASTGPGTAGDALGPVSNLMSITFVVLMAAFVIQVMTQIMHNGR